MIGLGRDFCCGTQGAGGMPGKGQAAGQAAGGTIQKKYWRLLIVLALCCSGLYLLPYYRSTFPFRSISWAFRQVPFRQNSLLGSLNFKMMRNTSYWKSSQALKEAILNGSAPPLLTLFTTWSDHKDTSLVRNLTLRNWAQLKPFIVPVLFSNNSHLSAQALVSGWNTLSVSRSAVGVPVLKNMYLDAMKRFSTTLYAFSNGDIIFTRSLVDSLLAILSEPTLPLDDNPLLVVGQRTNVPMVTAQETVTFENITKMAKSRGKLFSILGEDFFITNRRFPWDSIPGVVIGRIAFDNWLVLHAFQHKHIVVDVTETVLAVHQTTKGGNHEGASRANSSYNMDLLKNLYKEIDYAKGGVDCAPWYTNQSQKGKLRLERRHKIPNRC